MRRLILVLLVLSLLALTGAAVAQPKADWNLAPTATAHLVERLELLNNATCTLQIGGSGSIVDGIFIMGDHLEVTIRCDR